MRALSKTMSKRNQSFPAQIAESLAFDRPVVIVGVGWIRSLLFLIFPLNYGRESSPQMDWDGVAYQPVPRIKKLIYSELQNGFEKVPDGWLVH